MTIDDDTAESRQGKTDARRRGRGWGLNTLPSVRKHLARVLSDIDQGKIDLAKARTLIYGLTTAGNIVKAEIDSGLEERIDKLYDLLMTKKEQRNEK